MKKLPKNFYPSIVKLLRTKNSKKVRRLDRDIRKKKPLSSETVVLKAPHTIGLNSPALHHELSSFLLRLRNEIAGQKHRRVVINFRETTLFAPAGTILLLAEIDRISRLSNQKTGLTCYYPFDETAEKVMQQVGLLKLLNRKERKLITKQDADVYHWHYFTGSEASGENAASMCTSLKDKLPTGSLKQIFNAVTEAMVNSVHHAYEEPRNDSISKNMPESQKRWWFFGEILNGGLHIVFCDLGIGIPRSLPRNWREYCIDSLRMSKVSSGKHDLKMIEKALELGRTRTAKTNRGLGFHQNIVAAAEKLGGKLLIYSNKAVVNIDYTDSRNHVKIRDHFKRSILGTVILWTIPIESAQGGKEV